MSSAGHPCYSGDDGSTVSCRRRVHARSPGVRLCRWRCPDEAADCRGFAGRRDGWPAAGSAARLALRVALPEGFHVQSNAPRDPTLIPTVLTIDAPAGVSVEEIVYPPPTDLEQVGQKQPLAVFEREFAIGVVVRVDSKAAPGEIALPAHLRYQTCNAQLCFAPTTANTQWTLRVVPTDATIAEQNGDVFKGIAFGHGTKPPAAAPSSVTATSPQVAVAGQSRGIAALDGFTELDSAVGYQRSSEFLQWIRDTEAGVKRGGLFEGRGPLAILFLVVSSAGSPST